MNGPQVLPDRFPAAGGVDGTTGCGRAPMDSDETCGAPATWHIQWAPAASGEAASASFACDTHMAKARERFVYAIRHKVSADCNMPGALYSSRRCHVPAPTFETGDADA